MLLWATAAFIKRRSLIAEVRAAVPTAAQAAWRRNSRRLLSRETGLGSIRLFLDGKVGRGDDQVNHGLHAVPYLVCGRWCAEREIVCIGYVSDDPVFRAQGDLTGREQGIERIHQR